MSKRAIIVTGSRDADPLEWAPRVRKIINDLSPNLILQGECPFGGIDEIAKTLAGDYGIPTEDFAADWDEAERVYGNRKKAGPIRNLAMLARLRDLEAEGWEIRVIAFHTDLTKSAGTRDMVRIAKKAKVRTMHVTLDHFEWLN